MVSRSNGDGGRRTIWQARDYGFNIGLRAKVEEILDYMYMIPVPARLVERGRDWPWSSARWYV
ncbi:hypothetical protein [Schlesneria sp. T3-172]|uniref:hypothetical protein n=1 Tax=Schlesneria sphaerica TaxID=3373610 RepID=UPI0037CC5B7C